MVSLALRSLLDADKFVHELARFGIIAITTLSRTACWFINEQIVTLILCSGQCAEIRGQKGTYKSTRSKAHRAMCSLQVAED